MQDDMVKGKTRVRVTNRYIRQGNATGNFEGTEAGMYLVRLDGDEHITNFFPGEIVPIWSPGTIERARRRAAR